MTTYHETLDFCVILFIFQKGVRPVHIKMEIFVVSSYYSFFLIDYSSLSFLIEATCIYGEQPNDPCPCFSCQNGLTCLMHEYPYKCS